MGEIRIPRAANQIDKIPDSPRKREGCNVTLNYESIQDTP